MKKGPKVLHKRAVWLGGAVARACCVLLLLAGSLQAQAQLEGTLDIHIHSAPDSMPRSITALETAREAKAAGMRALVLKNHYAETASLAFIVSQVVPGIEIYGGIALNRAVGGLNPVAIERMAMMTGNLGRVVWMPTYDSGHYNLTVMPNPNQVPVSQDGALLPEVFPVLEAIKANGLALATGHSSPAESLMLIRAARDIGIERILVTHASMRLIAMSMEQQKEAAALGAYIEYAIGFVLKSDEALAQYVADIKELGPEHVVLSTDLGQPNNPSHTEGLKQFVAKALAAGLTQQELDLMLKRNPAAFLGLE
jgi:hypothetical protein